MRRLAILLLAATTGCAGGGRGFAQALGRVAIETSAAAIRQGVLSRPGRFERPRAPAARGPKTEAEKEVERRWREARKR